MTTSAENRGVMGLTLIGVLMAITSINSAAIGVVVPILPSLREDLGVEIAEAQLVLSGYIVALALGHLFVGMLSDRFGRRPVMIAGTLVFSLAAGLAAFAPTIGILVLLRVVQGFGGSAGIVVARAVIRDLFDRDRAASVIGYLTMGLAIAPMVGPLVGGLLNDAFGWRSVLVMLSVLSLVAVAVAAAVMPETGNRQVGSTLRGLTADIRSLVTAPAFWAYATTMALVAGSYFSFLGGAPFVATELIGLSATQLGAFLLFVSLGYFIGNFLSGRFSQKVGAHRMINIGNLIAISGLVAMVAFFLIGLVNPWTLFLPVFFLGLGNGVSLPNATAGAISVRPEVAGTASGLSGAIQFGVSAIAIAFAGWALAALPAAMTVAVIMLVYTGTGAAVGIWTRFARS